MSTFNVPIEILPKQILSCASLSGYEYAWKPSDIPLVFEAARQARVANLGGQLQFRLPSATCELYWIETTAHERQETESWDDFVERSYAECTTQFQQLIHEYDFVAEGIKSFPFLADLHTSGVALSDYVYFVVYFDSEEQYG